MVAKDQRAFTSRCSFDGSRSGCISLGEPLNDLRDSAPHRGSRIITRLLKLARHVPCQSDREATVAVEPTSSNASRFRAGHVPAI